MQNVAFLLSSKPLFWIIKLPVFEYKPVYKIKILKRQFSENVRIINNRFLLIKISFKESLEF